MKQIKLSQLAADPSAYQGFYLYYEERRLLRIDRYPMPSAAYDFFYLDGTQETIFDFDGRVKLIAVHQSVMQ